MRFGTRHMTRKERTAFANVAGQQAWQAFRERVEAASNLEQARSVAAAGPAMTARRSAEPGSAFYKRLEIFLRDFDIPPQATPAERVLYRELLRKLGDAGDLEADRMWMLIEKLNHL